MNCTNCSEIVPDGETHCPACGTAVAETDVVEAIPEQVTKTRPWLVGVGVGLLVLVVGGVSLALLRNPAATAVFSDRMPSDMSTYVAVDARQIASDETKAVVQEFGGLIEAVTGEEFDVDSALDDLLEEVEAEMGPDLSYDDDIGSWASGSIAIGARFGADAFDQSVVAWVSGRDEAKLAAFLDKVEALAADEGISTNHVSIGGVDFIQSDSLEDGLIGQVGMDLLVVSDAALAEEVLSLTPETSLRNAPGFLERMSLVPQNAIVTFASDSSAMGALGLGSAATGMLGIDPASLTAIGGPTGADTGWVVGSLAIDNGNLRFDTVSGVDAEMAPSISDESPALQELPGEDAVLFARMAGLGQGIEALAGLLGPDVAGELEALTGLTVDQIAGLLEVDAALAVWPSSEPEIPIGAALVGVGNDDSAPVLEQLNKVLVESGGMVGVPIPGGYLYEGLVAFGGRGPLTILSSDRSLLQGSPAQSLAAGALYARAGDLVGAGYIPMLGVDIDGVIRLVDGFVDDPQILDALTCNPMRFIASGTNIDGELARNVFVVEIEAPASCN